MRPVVVIYTDGSCRIHNGGAGGWAALLIFKGGVVKEISGMVECTTNNRMEILAAIKALQYLDQCYDVLIHTDSRYLQNGATQWINGWKTRNWATKEGGSVLNQDLWELLDIEISRHVISWLHVKGHNGDTYNERCDQLATIASKEQLKCNQLQQQTT